MNKIMQLIIAYRNAAIADSWKGGGDPESIPAIEKEYATAERKLRKALAELVAERDKVVELLRNVKAFGSDGEAPGGLSVSGMIDNFFIDREKAHAR